MANQENHTQHDPEHWDRETDIKQQFNPDDIGHWLEYPPVEFLGIIIHELRRESLIIETYSAFLEQIEGIKEATLNINDQSLEAEFCLQAIARANRITHHLLDTAQSYREASNRPS